MILNKIKQLKKDDRGFTIVELLIVIVIIAILAAITIVAYNGITQRANTASAQLAAKNAISKLEAYNADAPAAKYPAYPSLITASTESAKTWYLTGVSFSASELTAAPATPNVLNFYACTAGARVDYYKYDGTAAWVSVYTGGGTLAVCGTYKGSGATS